MPEHVVDHLGRVVHQMRSSPQRARPAYAAGRTIFLRAERCEATCGPSEGGYDEFFGEFSSTPLELSGLRPQLLDHP
jgi:hypothetical protein